MVNRWGTGSDEIVNRLEEGKPTLRRCRKGRAPGWDDGEVREAGLPGGERGRQPSRGGVRSNL